MSSIFDLNDRERAALAAQGIDPDAVVAVQFPVQAVNVGATESGPSIEVGTVVPATLFDGAPPEGSTWAEVMRSVLVGARLRVLVDRRAFDASEMDAMDAAVQAAAAEGAARVVDP